MMTVLDARAGQKPLDFGDKGVVGSIDSDGRIIALNTCHTHAGMVTFTVADPFPDSQRYEVAAVRAYRKGLTELAGFGPYFAAPIVQRQVELLEDVIPHIRLQFADSSYAEVTTFAYGGGAIQFWHFQGATPIWRGRISLQRCAYTQITEGGTLAAMPVQSRLHLYTNGTLTLENPALECAVAIVGLPVEQAQAIEAQEPVSIELAGAAQDVTLIYAFGADAAAALAKANRLAQEAIPSLLSTLQHHWERAFATLPSNLMVRRGLAYIQMLAMPVRDGVCLLTDHMLLPLSWNRDAYYMVRALLQWNREQADTVRRHLLWMFEIAERVNGLWGRSYLANGQVKDRAFQLDQQLFPLLELADYVLITGDELTLKRLEAQIAPVLAALLERKASQAWLFTTDETPADDPIALPYHLSSHILFWRMLCKLEQIRMAGEWATWIPAIRAAIDQFFITTHQGKSLYSYATDGQGHFHFYHDANDFPLALAPAWGFLKADDAVWRTTVEFAFSAENHGGVYAGQLGSVHTPAPWALGDVQDMIIARAIGDAQREENALRRLQQAAQWDGALPEAYDAATKAVFARHWFAWPNAALACVLLDALQS